MKFAILSVIYGPGAKKYIENFVLNSDFYQYSNNYIRLVIDHGSHEISKEYWSSADVVHVSQKNKGFGAGVNSGLKIIFEKYQCDYAIVLNPDLKFTYKELCEISSEIKDKFYVIETEEYGKKKSILYYSYISGVIKTEKSYFSIPYFNGAAFVVSKKIYDDNIRFDERFFMYFEDLDFSIILKNSGVKINTISTSNIYHEVGGCVESGMHVKKERQAAISGIKFIIKNYPLNLILLIRYLGKYILASYRY